MPLWCAFAPLCLFIVPASLIKMYMTFDSRGKAFSGPNIFPTVHLSYIPGFLSSFSNFPAKFALFYTINLYYARENVPLSAQMWCIFPRVYKLTQNLQTSQGYIFRILQHFAAKLCNLTNFNMLFLAVVMDFSFPA